MRESTVTPRLPQGRRGALLAAAALGMVVPLWIVAVWGLGRNIPQPALGADYLSAVVWALALTLLLWIAPVPEQDRTSLLGLWVIKMGVALGFALVYESAYQGLDTYTYFLWSTTRGISWAQFDLGDGTRNTLSLARLHNLFLPNSYHTLKVTWSLLGLFGVYLAYRAGVRFRKQDDPRILWALALLPSTLFWSTTFGKDPLCLLGICMYVYGVVIAYDGQRRRGVVVAALGLFLAAIIRLWLFPIMVAPLLALALARTRSRWARIGLVVGALAAVWLSGRYFLQVLGFSSIDTLLKYAALAQNAMVTTGGSGVELSIDLSSPASILASLPLGMFTALFRPLPGDVMNAFGLLAGVENAFLLLLLAVAVKRTRLRELRQPLLAWALSLVFCWAAFYAFVSFNLGAAVRFKSQILPVLMLLLLYFARPRSPADAGPGVSTMAHSGGRS